ncbi:hypothetical protein SEA_KARDASHIAN_49 [Streptomyces phage Kardashian]|nr:hypothetical protein SEA_KARDASHIAN_49 [Streptomyces phage Kardashian]
METVALALVAIVMVVGGLIVLAKMLRAVANLLERFAVFLRKWSDKQEAKKNL